MTGPGTMRAVELRDYDGRTESLVVVERPVPVPAAGQVLIRINAAPINPSDLMFVRGLYGFKRPLPAVPGFEGSGIVVASGGGLMGKMLVGRRVACATASPDLRDGTWAEYAVTHARLAMPLRRDVDIEQAAMMLVNPLTAWALVDIARRGHHQAVVQSAAASALGRMIVRLGHRYGLPIVNVVRRIEQVELLTGAGVAPDLVINSSEPGFESQLRETCRRLGATLAFDAVGGKLTAQILRTMPRGSRALLYGSLALEACQIDPGSLIFEAKKVEGFWLSEWLRNRSLVGHIRLAMQVQRLLGNELKSEVQARYPLNAVTDALQRYSTNMSSGKVLLVPSL